MVMQTSHEIQGVRILSHKIRLTLTFSLNFYFLFFDSLSLMTELADNEIHKQTSAISTADLPVPGTAGMWSHHSSSRTPGGSNPRM